MDYTIIIRWLANESSYDYSDVEGEPTECTMGSYAQQAITFRHQFKQNA